MSAIGAKIGRVLGDVHEDGDGGSVAETDASSVSTKVDYMGEGSQGEFFEIWNGCGYLFLLHPDPRQR